MYPLTQAYQFLLDVVMFVFILWGHLLFNLCIVETQS